MATIFQKTPIDQCLILGSREALVYPFDVGTWSELRIGYVVSCTHVTGDNGWPAEETLATSSAKNLIYLGLKDSGSALPFTDGSTFVGAATNVTGAGTSSAQNIVGGVFAFHSNTSSSNVSLNAVITYNQSGINFSADNTSFSPLVMSVPSEMAGTGTTSNQAGYLVFRLTNRGQVGQAINVYSRNMGTASRVGHYTVDDIRSMLINVPQSSSSFNAFLTSSLTSTGTALQVPNAFFAYLPFFNNRLRLHSLVIEKFA